MGNLDIDNSVDESRILSQGVALFQLLTISFHHS